jgi:hypothetical protein
MKFYQSGDENAKGVKSNGSEIRSRFEIAFPTQGIAIPTSKLTVWRRKVLERPDIPLKIKTVLTASRI